MPTFCPASKINRANTIGDVFQWYYSTEMEPEIILQQSEGIKRYKIVKLQTENRSIQDKVALFEENVR